MLFLSLHSMCGNGQRRLCNHIVLITSISLILLLSGCVNNLTDKPPEEIPTKDLTPLQSNITIPVTINLASIESKLNDSVPQIITTWNDRNVPYRNHVNIIGKRVDYSVSGDVSGSVRRDGRIFVRGNGNKIHVEIPLKMSATFKVGAGSQVAIRIIRKLLGGLRQSADGKPVIAADISLSIDENWKPIWHADTSLKWNKPATLKIANLIPVTVNNLVEPKIREFLQNAETELASIIDSEKLKKDVEHGWNNLQDPIQISTSPEAWLNIQPKSIAFSGITANDSILRAILSAKIDSSIMLGDKPNSAEKKGLPLLGSLLPGEPNNFEIKIPINLSYKGIREVILSRAPIDRPIEIVSNGKRGQVTLKELVVYPSQGKLVVGARINANLPGHWLDVNGWFYFLALPTIDPNKKVIRLEGLTLARQTDNWLINAATSLIAIEPVRSLIEDKVEIPYGIQFDDLLAKSKESLNMKISNDIQLKGDLERFETLPIWLGRTGLVIPILAVGSLEVSSGL